MLTGSSKESPVSMLTRCTGRGSGQSDCEREIDHVPLSDPLSEDAADEKSFRYWCHIAANGEKLEEFCCHFAVILLLGQLLALIAPILSAFNRTVIDNEFSLFQK